MRSPPRPKVLDTRRQQRLGIKINRDSVKVKKNLLLKFDEHSSYAFEKESPVSDSFREPQALEQELEVVEKDLRERLSEPQDLREHLNAKRDLRTHLDAKRSSKIPVAANTEKRPRKHRRKASSSQRKSQPANCEQRFANCTSCDKSVPYAGQVARAVFLCENCRRK